MILKKMPTLFRRPLYRVCIIPHSTCPPTIRCESHPTSLTRSKQQNIRSFGHSVLTNSFDAEAISPSLLPHVSETEVIENRTVCEPQVLGKSPGDSQTPFILRIYRFYCFVGCQVNIQTWRFAHSCWGS